MRNETQPFVPPSRSIPVCAAFAATIALLAPAAASAIPYTVVRGPETLQQLPIGGGTVDNILTTSGDDIGTRWTIPGGFTFKFYANTFSAVTISTNGYITFQPGSRGTAWTPQTFPNSSDPSDILAVWWGDGYCDANQIRGQMLGTAPARQYVIEWNCRRLGQSNTWRAQAWLHEGSSTLSVVYGTYASPTDYGTVVIGVQNTGGSEYTYGLTCGGSCSGSAWPASTRVTYTQGPELSVTQVGVPVEGFAGIEMPVSSTVRNVGGQPAVDFTNQFWVSPAPFKGSDSIPLGINSTRQSANPGQQVVFDMTVRLPITLDPGTYYILAEADPDHVVPVTSRARSIGASAPFVVGVPAPNLEPRNVEVPAEIHPGQTFEVSWIAANTGNAAAVRAPFTIVLSTHDAPGASSRVLHRDELQLDKLSESTRTDEVYLPADVREGRYFIGVIMDPDFEVYEHEKSNNTAVSNPTLVTSLEGVAILTETLPSAEIASHYSVALEATGGDGSYHWRLMQGTRLPPGLSLMTWPEGARSAGLPYTTMLKGEPGLLGEFFFTLEVESAGTTDRRDFSLTVHQQSIPLTINTVELPTALFQSPYTVPLAASGGVPPYAWQLVGGRLPGGISFGSAGVFEGRAGDDGPFPVLVRVTDSRGVAASKDLTLHVTPPSRITCGSDRLQPRRLNEPFDDRLQAGGGIKPVWATKETYFLSSGPGEKWEWKNNEAPPGLVLSADGRITGKGTRAGLYEWVVDIRESAGVSNDLASCPIRVEILRDHNMTILTQALPDAVIGQRYAAQLEASGGEGDVVWSLLGNEKLPAGLTLSPEGLVAGTPTGEELAGEDAGSVAFSVRVGDAHNRFDTAPLSVTLLAVPTGIGPVEEVKETTNCQSAGSEPSLLLVAAIVGLAAVRRRRV